MPIEPHVGIHLNEERGVDLRSAGIQCPVERHEIADLDDLADRIGLAIDMRDGVVDGFADRQHERSDVRSGIARMTEDRLVRSGASNRRGCRRPGPEAGGHSLVPFSFVPGSRQELRWKLQNGRQRRTQHLSRVVAPVHEQAFSQLDTAAFQAIVESKAGIRPEQVRDSSPGSLHAEHGPHVIHLLDVANVLVPYPQPLKQNEFGITPEALTVRAARMPPQVGERPGHVVDPRDPRQTKVEVAVLRDLHALVEATDLGE